MKSAAITACTILLVFCPSHSQAMEPPATGAPAKSSTTKQEVVAAAEFAVKAHEKALNDPKAETSTKLELIKIVSAEEQVVAGMNYRLTLKVKQDGNERTAQAVVWWQAWRKPHPYQLTSWNWTTDAPPHASPGR